MGAASVADALWQVYLFHGVFGGIAAACLGIVPAAALIGRHDFTTFRSTMCQSASPVKTLDAIEIEELPIPSGAEYRFYLRARSFLHNQVRSIVGTLERVGAGAWPPERVAEALAAKDRAACGPVCPPQGLYLTGAGYPRDPFGGRITASSSESVSSRE